MVRVFTSTAPEILAIGAVKVLPGNDGTVKLTSVPSGIPAASYSGTGTTKRCRVRV